MLSVEQDNFTDLFSKEHCPDCAQLVELEARSKQDAQRYIARRLREGNCSDAFLRLVAELVDPDVKKRRGRPKGSSIDDFEAEIGADFVDLRRNGAKYQDAVAVLAEGYAYNERGVGRIVSARVLNPWREIHIWEREYGSWSTADKEVYHRDIEKITDSREMMDETEWKAQLSALADMEADRNAAMIRCKHHCSKGCRRKELASDRRSCALCSVNLARSLRH